MTSATKPSIFSANPLAIHKQLSARDNSKLLIICWNGVDRCSSYNAPDGARATSISSRQNSLREQQAGPTLIISPLLALMRNQITAAERAGIRAVRVTSEEKNRNDWGRIRDELLADRVDVLLISPERLGNEEFVQTMLQPVAARIGLLVVDEAHCISDWGHDFRPDYRRITRILQSLPPNIRVLATTATANDRVVADLKSQLGAALTVHRGKLARASLQLQNISLPSEIARLAWLAHTLPKLPGSGVIYTLTIRDARTVAAWLRENGIDAESYWGGLDEELGQPGLRERLEARLLRNELKVLVATTALGMGFDKPDLAFVIHYQLPGSVVHYYQQVGRAGRALPDAFAVLLGGGGDRDITDHFIETAFPPRELVEKILAQLDAAPDGLTLGELQIQTERSAWPPGSRAEIAFARIARAVAQAGQSLETHRRAARARVLGAC